MKLQNQVCTLEQAKRLKGLGVCQVSQCIWRDGQLEHVDSINSWSDQETVKEMLSKYDSIWEKGWRDDWQIYSAYTVAELGAMLPEWYPSWRFKVSEASNELKWLTTVIAGPKPPHVDDIHTLVEFDRYGDTQAESMATLLIALLETEAIKVEEVNERLKNA